MLTVSKHVQDAMTGGRPIVALETAVLTSGLPREPWQTSYGDCPTCIDSTLPINHALAIAVTKQVTDNEAIPAWIGLIDGEFKIGLSADEIEILCRNESAKKVSLATIAQTMTERGSAGTTVATTLLGCKLASPKKPIRVFATGGIGGFHQNWSSRLDVSADLMALATTPTCVVASGAKSILDLHATVEALETIGVPTVGVGCDTFPPFIEQISEEDPRVIRIDTTDALAAICNKHWNTLGLRSALLATVPAPESDAVKRGSLAEVLQEAETSWLESDLPSETRTPFLLNALASITCGCSLKANLALLCNNASIASQIAVAIAN